MKLAYAMTVCDRLIERLRSVSEKAGKPEAIEDCVFDARVLKDIMTVGKVCRRKWEESRRQKLAAAGKKKPSGQKGRRSA